MKRHTFAICIVLSILVFAASFVMMQQTAKAQASTATPTPMAPGDFGNVTITGNVRDVYGPTQICCEPTAGASITVSAVGPRSSSSGNATTDANGNYSVSNIHLYDTSTVTVTVSKTGFPTESTVRSGIATSTNKVFDFTLVPATPTPTRTRTPTGPTPTRTRTPTVTPVSTANDTPWPDLTVSSITYLGSNPACINQPKVQVVVANIGAFPANGSFSVNLNGGVAQTVNGLGAGQSVTLIFAASSSTAIVDTTNVITETNETNNSLMGNFGIPTQAHTCTPGVPTLTPTRTRTPTPNGPLSAEFVGSPLTGPAPLTVTFTATGNTAGTQSCTMYFGDGTALVVDFGCFSSFNHTYTNPGSYTVTFHVAGATDVTKSNYVVVSSGPTLTPTRTLTPIITNTPTRTPTPGTGGTCSPVTSTITAPFTWDGAGTFCWQSSNLGGYINNWNNTSVTINGVNITNVYMSSGSYPAKIGGFWYVSYSSSVAWGHFEAK